MGPALSDPHLKRCGAGTELVGLYKNLRVLQFCSSLIVPKLSRDLRIHCSKQPGDPATQGRAFACLLCLQHSTCRLGDAR